ncbi:hypothetical protein ACFS07_03425 [Undibacterium arcticum]
MALAHTLGFPRIGAHRELKLALESFWRGDSNEAALRDSGRTLRARHWALQADAGMDLVAVGDFAWYDHVLNTLALLGAIPARFKFDPKRLTLSDYFTLARGSKEHFAMEMTKWFDTNYHYLVPEWTPNVCFDGGVDWLFDEIAEARAQNHRAKVVLVGPLTLLYLGKIKSGLTHKLDLLPRIVAGYQNVLKRLQAMGVEWVQIDEPILALDLDTAWRDAFAPTYAALTKAAPPLLLATYFDEVRAHAALLRDLPVAGVHLDLVRGADQLGDFLGDWPQDRVLSVGIVDGRNIWRTDLDAALVKLAPIQIALGDRLWIAPSCSLLHVPVDLAHETKLDAELKKLARLCHAKARRNRRAETCAEPRDRNRATAVLGSPCRCHCTPTFPAYPQWLGAKAAGEGVRRRCATRCGVRCTHRQTTGEMEFAAVSHHDDRFVSPNVRDSAGTRRV